MEKARDFQVFDRKKRASHMNSLFYKNYFLGKPEDACRSPAKPGHQPEAEAAGGGQSEAGPPLQPQHI